MFKKITGFILLFALFGTSVFALSNLEKGKAIKKYQEKQKEFIFENISDFDTLEALNLFKANNRKNIYENILNNVSKKREEIEQKNLKIIKKIGDLTYQLNNLDKQVKDLKQETRKINLEIIDKTSSIKEKKDNIEQIEKKLEKTEKVLKKYIVYIYKKGNIFLNDGKLDNFKAVLLSGKSLDKVLNDIYFKELLAQAGKNLLKKYRKLVFDLYIEKKNLENDTFALKQLRKRFVIKKKILENKKTFKEKILAISKGKESLYKKYIESKRNIEKNLKLKSFAQRIKFYQASKKVLKKYGCKFVDVSKNTPEARALSQKCYNLNKVIALEAKLEENRLKKITSSVNIFSWPVNPKKGISSYFKDEKYKKLFGVEHNAIDIVVDQGTSIKAPIDGYVLDYKEPVDSSYAYIILKHVNGFVTVYGHISEINPDIEKYSYIKAGDIFAKTGGMFGTNGAGFITTGPHLHFEVLRNKDWVDPLQYLNLSYLKYKEVPEHLKAKYIADYKERTGKDFYVKRSNTRTFILEGNTEIERQKSLLRKYARKDFSNWRMWIEESLRWHIDPTFMMCIGLAETGLGRHLKTSYNVGNVGNVDSGGTWSMDTPRKGIWWMGHTLNNRYLGKYNKIYQLSGYGRQGNAPIYASSKLNWHRNVIKCMSAIKGYQVPDGYNFRTY